MEVLLLDVARLALKRAVTLAAVLVRSKLHSGKESLITRFRAAKLASLRAVETYD